MDRPWERAEERAQRERERMARAERLPPLPREDPPRRDDERYGPLAQNPDGDDAFRDDRREWFERETGESLEGASVTEQWQRVDTYARRFRAYSDGRTPK